MKDDVGAVIRTGDLCRVECASWAESATFIALDERCRNFVDHGTPLLFLCIDPRHSENWALVFVEGALGYMRQNALKRVET